MLGPERQRHLIETYKNRIRSLAGVNHVWSFAMFGKNSELIYWLIFSTNSPKGLEQMKKATEKYIHDVKIKDFPNNKEQY